MSRDRAEQRAIALHVVMSAMDSLAEEDREIVLEDAAFRVRAAKGVRSNRTRARSRTKAQTGRGPERSLEAVLRRAQEATAALPTVQRLETAKSKRRRAVLLAVLEHSPAPYMWLCRRVYNRVEKTDRQALSTLLMNMRSKGLIETVSPGEYALTPLGRELAVSLAERARAPHPVSSVG